MIRTAFAKGRLVIDGTEAFAISGTPAHEDDGDSNTIEADLVLEPGHGHETATVAVLHVGIPDIGVFGLELTRNDLVYLSNAIQDIL